MPNVCFTENTQRSVCTLAICIAHQGHAHCSSTTRCFRLIARWPSVSDISDLGTTVGSCAQRWPQVALHTLKRLCSRVSLVTASCSWLLVTLLSCVVPSAVAWLVPPVSQRCLCGALEDLRTPTGLVLHVVLHHGLGFLPPFRAPALLQAARNRRQLA